MKHLGVTRQSALGGARKVATMPVLNRMVVRAAAAPVGTWYLVFVINHRHMRFEYIG